MMLLFMNFSEYLKTHYNYSDAEYVGLSEAKRDEIRKTYRMYKANYEKLKA